MITLKDAIENWLKDAFVKRYFGRFVINKKLIEEKPELLMKDIFSKMVIIRAEYLLESNMIEYSAYSPELFELVPDGQVVPEYMACITEDGELSMVKV